MRTYHGYSLEELNELVKSKIDFDGEIRLDSTLLEGWSSLNILGYHNNNPAFILKLPKSSEVQNFDNINLIHNQLSKFDLCPRPLYHGMLDDDDLPSIVLEYISGRMYDSPFDISQEDYWRLGNVLERLATLTIRGIPEYSDAVEHLNAITRPMELRIYDYGRNLTRGLSHLFEEFISLADVSRNRLEGCKWDPVTVHGDLFERNIVFREDVVILLDMEECCVSDRFYDRAYLFAQSYTEKALSEEDPIRTVCPRDHWLNLEILALCSVITWSLQRLLDLELGLIELNLSQFVPDDLVKEKTPAYGCQT
ncbi:MAG: phosphotransferase [Candidatus Thorarchaeota archaeon]